MMVSKKNSDKPKKLTSFGEYLAIRSVNKSDVARKVGISLTRINRLCYDTKAYLRSYELQLIALAINVDPTKMQKDLFGHLTLKEEFSPSEKIINRITKALNEADLIDQNDLSAQDIARVSKILPYCIEERLEADLLSHLGLKRKSSKLTATLKACTQAGWLKMLQKNSDGFITTHYVTTEDGKIIVEG